MTSVKMRCACQNSASISQGEVWLSATSQLCLLTAPQLGSPQPFWLVLSLKVIPWHLCEGQLCPKTITLTVRILLVYKQ